MLNEAQLTAELKRYGVYFLANRTSDYGQRLTPEKLITTLASHSQARLRLALIPLFLTQPTFSTSVEVVKNLLDDPSQVTLACYYTAARLLQQKYHPTLADTFGGQPPLPDLFKDLFHLEGDTADDRLHQLAEQQAKRTNRFINWYGTYHHAFQSFIKAQPHKHHTHA